MEVANVRWRKQIASRVIFMKYGNQSRDALETKRNLNTQILTASRV
jgi:hypothetical protein